MEMLNLISQKGLSPNQFYLLYSIKEKLGPVNINIAQEIRSLNGTWIVPNDQGYSLLPNAIALVDQVEKYFKVQKKKTNEEIMGKDFAENLAKYQEFFPKKRLPSGKVARSNDTVVENSLRWFFENYTYSWPTLLAATALYVDEYEKKKYEFMRTSAYFIRKTEKDKSVISDLADYCSIIESGEDLDDTHFSEKVV